MYCVSLYRLFVFFSLLSCSQENNLNNVRDASTNLNFEDVRASMAGDSRVVAVEASRGPSRPTSGISRDFSSRDSLQQPSNFHRNTLNPAQHAMEVNNNGNIRGQGHLLGTSGQNARSRPSTAGGVHSSWNGSGRQGMVNSAGNQRPVSASVSSLGFSLPTLSPRDTNIVSSRNDRSPPMKSPKTAAKKKAQTGKKDKTEKGKKMRNSMSASRESFENAGSRSVSQEDSFLLAGHAVMNNGMESMGVKKNVIDAEFEDDYSELGLSVDRQGFNMLQSGGYHIPAFNSSHKPKSRSGTLESQSGMRASQSVENFGGLGITAIPEELHRRPEAAESYDFAMRKSATHDGLFKSVEQSSSSGIGDSKDGTIPDHDTNGKFMQDNRESITSSFMTGSMDGEKSTAGNYSNINDMINSFEATVPQVPKLLFGANPVHADSTDFEKTRAQPSSDNLRGTEMSKRSVIQEEFASDTLQTILGRERMERLLKNLEESAWLEDENSTLVGVTQALRGDISLESVCSGSEVGGTTTAPFAAKSTDLTDLGLTTHRPSEEARYNPHMDKAGTSASIVSESGASSVRRSTKCSFSSNEIYARARKLSNNSANEDEINEQLQSQTEQLQPKNNLQGVTKSSTLSDFLDSRNHHDTDQESASKFDYIRGIHSVKKEFYKTVAVTDSTAVSDSSTAKFSKQSVDSPRGQIHRPSAQAQRQSLSASEEHGQPRVNSMKEEHIEGIRQHVADIRYGISISWKINIDISAKYVDVLSPQLFW